MHEFSASAKRQLVYVQGGEDVLADAILRPVVDLGTPEEIIVGVIGAVCQV
jgi:hypothetical protein